MEQKDRSFTRWGRKGIHKKGSDGSISTIRRTEGAGEVRGRVMIVGVRSEVDSKDEQERSSGSYAL